MAILSKKEQWLTRCGSAEGVSTTSCRGQPKSKFLSAYKGGATLLWDLGLSSGEYANNPTCMATPLMAGQTAISEAINSIDFLRTPQGFLHPSGKIFVGGKASDMVLRAFTN